MPSLHFGDVNRRPRASLSAGARLQRPINSGSLDQGTAHLAGAAHTWLATMLLGVIHTVIGQLNQHAPVVQRITQTPATPMLQSPERLPAAHPAHVRAAAPVFARLAPDRYYWA